MLKNRFILPSILSIMYVFSCIMAFSFHIARPATDKFSAMFIGILTMPWSLLEALFHDLIIAPIFNYTFSSVVLNISLVVWVIVNTFLIFIICNKIRKQR
jgi:hypothetical protein